MKQRYKLFLIACLAILFVDAIGSILSRQLNFNYVMIWPASILIYCALGFVASKAENLKTSILLTSLLGVFDATVGWKISMALNANTGKLNNYLTPQSWLITILAVALYGALLGLISGYIAFLLNRKNNTKATPVRI